MAVDMESAELNARLSKLCRDVTLLEEGHTETRRVLAHMQKTLDKLIEYNIDKMRGCKKPRLVSDVFTIP